MKTYMWTKNQIATAFTALLLSVFSQVNGTAIVVSNNAASGAGSFDAAITFCNSNTATAPHTITFSNALDGLTIPSITGNDLNCPNVTIDGTTMSAYACKNPRVMINCNAFNGWKWTSNNCTIKGVRINGGIQFNGTGAHKVISCLFNIDFAGAAMASGAKACVRTNVAGSINNIIGGLTSCEGNVMSAMGSMCICFDAGGTGTQVLGNYMGTDITGLVTLGTGFTTRVIDIEAGNNIVIDGNTMGFVTGSSQGQAIMVNGGTGHTIQNNNIGANANRLFIAGLAFPGSMAVYFNGSNGSNSTMMNNVVGNCTAIVSAGIGGNVITVEGSSNVNLTGNYIGCDINFNNGGSSWAGVYYYAGATGATISGNYIGYNGILSGQRSHGLALFNIGGTFNVTNNYIGVTPAGANMGNGDAGIEMNTSSSPYVLNITGNYIGFNRCMRATSPGSLTSESGGIRVIDGKTITISNNYIGTIAGGRLDCGNLAMGIGIEGSTATGITISNNVIAYNKKNAIQTYGNGSDKVLISQNCIFCNTYEGIELTNGTLGSPTAGIGNASFGRTFATSEGAKPVSISTSGAWISNFSGNPYILRGYAPAGSSVEIFQNHHCNCDATSAFAGAQSAGGRMQGIDYIATVTADANGHWTYNLNTNAIKNGITVTASDLVNKRTSEFAPCVSVTQTCMPPLTVTTTGSNTLTPCVGDPFSIAGGATFVRTSCYNNIYYTWLKDGVVIYGPSLTYIPYSVVAAADPADDGNYQLRVEDGSAANVTCYLQSSPAVNVDVIPCPPLTINLLSFSGASFADHNVLNWNIIADEFANVELQSAADGKNFSTIHTTGIYANTTERFEDFTSASVMYYRLKITPGNGKFYYSSVVTLKKVTDVEVVVLNTKVDDVLNIQATSNSDQPVSYTIYDVKGVVVSSGTLQVTAGASRQNISVQGLPSAMYLIRFEAESSGYVNTERFIK